MQREPLNFLAELLKPGRSCRPAFFRNDAVLSLEQVFVMAWDICVHLPKSAAGDTVILAVDDSAELLAGILAVWIWDGVPMIPNGFREEALRKAAAFGSIIVSKGSILRENEVSLGFQDSAALLDITDLSRDPEFREVSIAERRRDFRMSLEALSQEDPSLLELLQLTSGSTGEPKVIGRTLAGLMREVSALDSLGIIRKDLLSLSVSTVPNYHAYGIMFRFFFPLAMDIPVYDAMLRYEEQFSLPERLGIPYYTVSNPGFLKRLSAEGSLRNCRLLISAGGRLTDKARVRGQAFFGGEVLEIFGSTETGAMAYRYTGDSVALWHPVPGNRFYVAARDTPESGTEVILMTASGEGLFLLESPYLENAALTGAFQGRKIPVFASGDAVSISGEGFLTLLGRQGRLIKIEDNRVSLDEVEAGFSFIPEIQDAAVVSYDKDGREGTLAFVTLNEQGLRTLAATSAGKMIIGFRNILRNHMLPLAVPRKFIFLPAMPVNANGKTDYVKLNARARELETDLSPDEIDNMYDTFSRKGIEIIDDSNSNDQSDDEVDIDDNDTPLAEGTWAVINLIAAILTTLGAIVALFRKKEEEDEDEEDQNKDKAEDEDEDDNRGKKMLAAKIAGAVAGIASPIIFILTEDMSLPMALIDKWTLLMAVVLVAQIVAAIFNKKASELDDDEEEAEPAN